MPLRHAFHAAPSHMLSTRDTPDGYHYVRLQKVENDSSSELLIVGGEDHKTGQADDFDERFERLEAWARERFASVQSVEYRWSGQVLEPVDGLAFMGPILWGNKYLHCIRRFRPWDDSWHDCRNCVTRPDPGPQQPLGPAL